MEFIVKLLYNLLIFCGASISVLILVAVLPLILIYRAFIVLCANFFRPDLESIVSGIDIIYSKDIGLWDTKVEEVIIGVITLKSVLSYEKVRKYFEDAMRDKRNARLCQYMVPWMGFGFWKRENNFSVNNHIFVKDDGEVRDDKWLSEFTKILLKKPFEKNSSPWEIYILPKYQPSPGDSNQSVFILRHHHSLLDGYSILKLLSKAYDNYVPIKYEDLNRTVQSSKMSYFKSCLRVPFTFFTMVLENNDWFRQPWKKFTGEMSIASVKVPVEKLVSVKQKYKVGLNPILFAGVTAAFRKILFRAHAEIPKKIHMAFSIPMQNHPEHLCNHFIGLAIALPVGTADPVERLVSIDSEYERITTSEIPHFFDLIQKILGCLPCWIVSLVTQTRLSAVFSFLPIGTQNELFGCPIGDFHTSFQVPISRANAGIMIIGLMNNGSLHLRGTFDKSVLSSDETARDVMESINDYYDSLLIK